MFLVSRLIYISIYVIMVVRVSFVWSLLPDLVATHFNFRGEPDDAMKPKNFVLLISCIYFFCVSPLFFVSWWFDFLPARFQQIPHKQQWFGGDNKDMRAKHISSVSYRFCAVGILIAAFIALLTELILRANLNNPPHISVPVVLAAVGMFVALIAAWVSLFHFAFEPKIRKD